jgi:hypothetical protein
LSAFSFARMATPENTKLCDFTSTSSLDITWFAFSAPSSKALKKSTLGR